MQTVDGEVVLYWRNGKVKRRCAFVSGVRSGWDRMWNEEGILVDEGQYEGGVPVGVHRRWNSKGALIEEIVYLSTGRFNFQQWDDGGNLRVEALWIDEEQYRERVWDRFQNSWIEREGCWNGRLVYV